jgi:putative pyruvate formate lyase activating enzyme
MNDLDSLYDDCTLCPRLCKVNRREGRKGFCGQTDKLKVASACLHKGEEPVLTGDRGSGTVFFSGCSLKCQYCQNYQISRLGEGGEISAAELALIFLALQEQGAANINLVSGTHFAPGIIQALNLARRDGLNLPIVWNSSGYEEVNLLKLIAPYVDVYLPDLKTLDGNLAKAVFRAGDYPQKAMDAIRFMHGKAETAYAGGQMKKGLIVRHLVLPGHVVSTCEVLESFNAYFRDKALLSLMFQFIPVTGTEPPDIENRKLEQSEYESVLAYLDDLGIEEGFVQDFTESDSWIPDFSRENPFPADYAVPVFHYLKGFIRGR